MNKLKKRYGFTLAEVLMVVAIVLILSAVAFVSVPKYQRSLGQLERDGIAKEIFVAAQNNLSALYGEDYLGHVIAEGATEDPYFGKKDTSDSTKKDVFCIDNSKLDSSILAQMLPYGSIDDTIRAGGSYIIRYQKDTGTVLDVFYCSKSDGYNTFNHTLSLDEIATILELRDDDGANKKAERRTYASGGNSILGWYGGTKAATLHTVKLKPPTIKIVNEEKLYVEVTDTNQSIAGSKIRIVVTGVTSKAEKTIVLSSSGRVKEQSGAPRTYTIILDDVTTENMHFAKLDHDTGTDPFIPGEDIEVKAIAYNNSELSNIAYSASVGSNSLFGSNNGSGKVTISNMRHLENLDRAISNLDAGVTVATAEQIVDLSWKVFRQNIRDIENKKENYGIGDPDTVVVYKWNGGNTAAKVYLPIEPNYAFTYEGKNHRVSDLYVRGLDKAGLFGATTSGTVIKDLELLDFDIQGSTAAGTLAATTSSATVTNVIARYTDPNNILNPKVSAPTAGGLIGSMSGGSVTYCGAIMTVEATVTAGGLIGTSSGDVTGCYSSGRTTEGSYKKWVAASAHPYDVTAATAGGLIGVASSGTISNSYTTCSVSGSTAAGGFAGTAGGSITNSYSTGLVYSSGSTKYAFAGGSPNLSGDYYYSIINEEIANPNLYPDWVETYDLLLPVSGYDPEHPTDNIKPIDLDLETYNEFVDASNKWEVCMAYDSKLDEYYEGKYNFKTIKQLDGSEKPSGYNGWGQVFVSMHYGDWPAPEILTINQ